MTFTFTEEQEELRRTVRRFLEHTSSPSQARRLMETADGYDAGVWTRMAAELGPQGLTIPEQYGGAGFGPVERLIVLEEMGRVLLYTPYLSSAVLAVDALRASGDEAALRALLPGIADGSTIATLAVQETDGEWTADGLQVRARRSGDRYVIDGQKSFVLYGAIANLILVAAQAGAGPTLFAVEGIGFTWEHDAHLYYRRAKSSEALLGSPTHHREIAATHLIDAAVARP